MGNDSQLETIFGRAIEIATAEDRKAFLEEACGNDTALLQNIDRLVADHFRAGEFLDQPIVQVNTPDIFTSEPNYIGARIGPYVIREQLGEGGMGIVFVAEQVDPVRRKVALKLIRPGMSSKDVIARFEAERQALAMMNHPHVAKVLDGGVTEAGQPYFVMELIQGVVVTEYCDEQCLTTRERLGLFLQVCQAVHHAHQKGIIHRDLKPSNILVSEIDGAAVCKVIDFGIAKAVDQKLTERTLYTQLSQMVGTPLYMSPEQVGRGVIDVDTRSDVYSLGVVLYELLTGTVPINRELMKSANEEQIRRIICEDPPSRPSAMVTTLNAETLATVASHRRREPGKLATDLQGELDWLVLKALEKDRDRRYESASALADDIERYLGDLPVVARPPSAAYRCRKFVRRNRVLVGSLSMVLISLTLGTVLATVGFVNARAQRDIAKKAEETAQRQLADTNVLADLLGELLPGPEWSTNTLGQHHTVYKAIEKVSPSLEQRLRDHPAVEIKVRRIFGRAYTAAGEFDKAREQLNLALHLAEQEYGQEDFVVAAIHTQLADEVGWRNWGPLDYPTLLAHAERAIEIYEAKGQEASVTAWFAKAWCMVAWPERWDEAEAAQRKCVELSQRAGTPGVIPLWDLGLLLVHVGDVRLDDAREILEKAVTAARLQSNPLVQATANEGLGRCLRQQGEIDLAIKSFQAALKLYRSDDELKRDPRRFRAEFRLAESLFAAGDVDQAFELAAGIELLAHDGAPADLLVDSVFFHGWLYYQLRIYETAKELFQRSTNLAEEHLGQQHVSFAYSCGYLALSLEASGESEQAVLLFERLRSLTTDGVDLPFASIEMHWGHGLALSATVVDDSPGELDAAQQAAQKGLHEVERRKWTWKEPAFCQLMAEAHRRRAQPQAAIDALRSGLEKAVEPHATFRSSQHDVPTTRTGLELLLASIYVQENLLGDARGVLEEAVQIRAKNLTDGHIQVALAQLRLGEFLISQSEYQAAEEPLLKTYEQLKPHSTVVDPFRRRAANKLVELYQMTDQPKEAAKWQSKFDTLISNGEINEAG